jgi:hypothetical protein
MDHQKNTTVQCEAIYMNAKQLNSVQGETPTFTGEDAARLQSEFITKVTDTGKAT